MDVLFVAFRYRVGLFVGWGGFLVTFGHEDGMSGGLPAAFRYRDGLLVRTGCL